MKSNDIPPSQDELDRYYGKPLTEFDINSALRDQLQALDSEDCAQAASDWHELILKAMNDDNAEEIGKIMIKALREIAQDRADFFLYGRKK
jgi:hypothetical protein